VSVRSVEFNNRRRDFTVGVGTASYRLPYSRLATPLPVGEHVTSAFVDPEIANEGFTYSTGAGREGTVHVEQVLEYNRDPEYLRESLLYALTLAAQRRLARVTLSRRELARRIGSSPTQLYRLLDATNTRKSVDRMLTLLSALDCEVDMRVRPRHASTAGARAQGLR
jgi:DNA-binding TFAR19-related protein (PDSD5 family)